MELPVALVVVAFQMQEKELPLEHKLGHDHSSKSTQLGTSEVSLSPERLGLARQNKHIWDSCQLCAWQEARSSSQQSGRAHQLRSQISCLVNRTPRSQERWFFQN